MSRTLPPYPSGNNWYEWATLLVDFLMARERIEQESLPQPIQLPHRISDEKALADGLLMYDPVAGEVIVSKGGQWTKISDGTPI